jgi:hypothetical protein
MQTEPMHDQPTGPADRSIYAGRRVALLTQHGKQRVLAPVLQRALECRVEHVRGYDTDQLGTFTREIPRQGDQLEAARAKARIGMQLSGLPLGLASEGSFGADPFGGLLPWNRELLVWIDDERELEVVAMAQGAAAFAHLLATQWHAVAEFAGRLPFPAHGLVVRPDGEQGSPVRKGIDSWLGLEAAFHWALAQSANGFVFVEMDVRAHVNPTRMAMIGQAAEDLARRLASRCPVCATPGFAVVEIVGGLRCADCGAPTAEARADVLACLKCVHRVTRPRVDAVLADPGRCDYCNP